MLRSGGASWFYLSLSRYMPLVGRSLSVTAFSGASAPRPDQNGTKYGRFKLNSTCYMIQNNWLETNSSRMWSVSTSKCNRVQITQFTTQLFGTNQDEKGSNIIALTSRLRYLPNASMTDLDIRRRWSRCSCFISWMVIPGLGCWRAIGPRSIRCSGLSKARSWLTGSRYPDIVRYYFVYSTRWIKIFVL